MRPAANGFGGVGLALWLLFLAGWWGAAWWTARAVSRGPVRQRLLYPGGFAVGFGLLFASARPLAGHGMPPAASLPPLWHVAGPAGAALLAIEVAGFAFAWWARLHLGRLWSGMLTLREGHRVVDSGPYRLVRHPIYTGFILAATGYALIVADLGALAGATVLAAG